MVSQYRFERLDLNTNAIRLVKLLKGDADQAIECTMFQTFLDPDEGVPYEALSYVWGPKEPEHHIWVDGSLFIVRLNLFQALTDLRHHDEDRVLWIDAICIDQSHAAERGHQVSQMNRVYSAAQHVVIWLGTTNSEIDQLFRWMRCLDKQVLETLPSHTKLDFQMWEQAWMLLLLRSNEGTCPDLIHRGLWALSQRAWFSRIWVVQEAALARSAIITCGRNFVSSRAFVVMPKLLKVECKTNIQARLDIMPGPLRLGADSWWSGTSSQDLAGLLQRLGDAEATDPRDIVYALLGLSAHASTSDILRPNYDLNLTETIQHTVLYLLQRMGYLQGIHTAGRLPIWNMNQLLFALEDLPQHFYAWAVDHGKDALVTRLLSSQEDIQRLQLADKFIRGSISNISSSPTSDKIKPSVLELLLLYRDVYHLRHNPDGVWLFPVVHAMRGGTALGPPILKSEEVLDSKSSLMVAILKRRSKATIEIIVDYPKLNGFILDAADLSAVARRGIKVLDLFSDQSIEVYIWRQEHVLQTSIWSRKSWRPMPYDNLDRTHPAEVLRDILRDGTNILCMGLITGRTELLRESQGAMWGLANKRWQNFRTPLGFAAEVNNVTIAALLLGLGANIESRDLRRPYATPLWIAASRGHIETVCLLVSKGANIEALGGEFGSQCTPLWIAASKGYKKIVSFLVGRGADVDVSAWDSDMIRTAAEAAAAKSHSGVLRILVEKGRARWDGRVIA